MYQEELKLGLCSVSEDYESTPRVGCELCPYEAYLESDLRKHLEEVHHKIGDHELKIENLLGEEDGADLVTMGTGNEDKHPHREDAEEIVCSLNPVKFDLESITCFEGEYGSESESVGLGKEDGDWSGIVNSKETDDILENDASVRYEIVNDIVKDIISHAVTEGGVTKRDDLPVPKKVFNKALRGAPKIHRCDKCLYATSNIGHLREHIKGRHDTIWKISRIKDIICQECGMAFFRKKSLKAHVDCVHRKVKNHVCEICGKAYKYIRELNNHINGDHMGKKHECEVCHYKSSYLSNLRAHLKVQHGIVRERAGQQYGPRNTEDNDRS